MLLLAFDTAGPYCAVALARGSRYDVEILAQSSERIVRGHAERIVPMIEAALEQTRVRFGEFDRIAVTTGPGSFTGVRVGVATARGLGLAIGIPVVGVGSLEALALDATQSHRHGTVVALLDGRRGEIYAFAQDIASGEILQEAAVFRSGDLAERLASFAEPLILTGAGAALAAGALKESGVEIIGAAEAPEIASVAEIGLRSGSAGPPVPHYLRGADAKPQTGWAVARA